MTTTDVDHLQTAIIVTFVEDVVCVFMDVFVFVFM